jgi:alkylation response protein AidB-like acyl-CoA dehydrogenase
MSGGRLLRAPDGVSDVASKDGDKQRSDRLFRALSALTDRIRTTARASDTSDQFPADAINQLRDAGVLAAPIPQADGGLGWGTEAQHNATFCEALMAVGRTSLSLGRIYEAHVNAIRLIHRYGQAPVREAAWSDVRGGHLFALWVAPSPGPVRLRRSGAQWRVSGSKGYGTAAGFASRAIVTAIDEDDAERMVLIDATRTSVRDVPPPMHGMRGTSTRPVSFDIEVSDEQFVGGAGDYVREPEFSAGAWRTTAVTAGGLQALVYETAAQLRARDRHRDPHQSARLGRLFILAQSAAMWAAAAAERVAMPGVATDDLTAFVNLARIAVEQACLEAIPLVQRSLGIASVLMSNPVEVLIRDIDTYLRQPAADEALSEAAMRFAEHGMPRAGARA